MKVIGKLLSCLMVFQLFFITPTSSQATKVDTTNKPYEVVVTPYKTTLLANGKDASIIKISVVDRQGRDVPGANNLIRFSVSGDAKIIDVPNDDSSGQQKRLVNGSCKVTLQAGTTVDIIKFEASSDTLRKGSTGIHTIRPNQIATEGKARTKPAKRKKVGKMLGADISFLPQLEERGMKFSDKGVQKDAIEILKDHGFNYIRLRIFNDPAADSGYSPKKGFCDLEHTKQMAKRVKAAGMKLLLDFHYSDYWADPEKQYKPKAWRGLNFTQLKDSVYSYTKMVIQVLKDQGTTPDMVQAGNEINHGIIWPEGHVNHLDSLAALIKAGSAAVMDVDPSILMMLHVALGGQNEESVFFIDNMIARGVQFDVIGESYYPKWHGTLDDLRHNLTDLARRYPQDVILVEYSQLKQQVNNIAFNLPKGKGKGTCIWEPLNTWEKIFDSQGKSNELLAVYDEISRQFMVK